METENTSQQTNQSQIVSENQPTQGIINNQRRNVPIIIGVVLLLFIVGGGAYFLGMQKNNPTYTQKANPSPTPTAENTQHTTPTTNPSPNVGQTANWKTYTSQEGKYSIKYPNNVKIYVNEKFSVDGVKVPLKDTIVLLSDVLPGLNTNYQMSINHKLTSSSTLNDFVDKNSSCVSIDARKEKLYTLGGKQALIFENTLCGPYGVTSIYSLNNGLGYIIEIETQAGYNDIKKYIDEILSTFQFN